MPEIFYRFSFLLLWICYSAIRYPFTRMYQQQQKLIAASTIWKRLELFLLGIGLLVVPLFWVFTSYFSDYNIPLNNPLRCGGLLLSGLSLIYFRAIHRRLGTNWSPSLEIMKDHQLITSGPYTWIRHPMYAQIWLWVLGQALITANWIAGSSGLLCWGMVYFFRVRSEERLLIKVFGERYISYMRHTGRIVPRWRWSKEQL